MGHPIAVFSSLALVLLWTANAQAAGVIGPSRLSTKIVDADTGRPLEGVVVEAAESYYWTGFHSSGTTCFRAASAVLGAANPVLSLPAVDPITSAKVTEGTRHIEVIAYRAGYCAAQPFASAGWAGFNKWAGQTQPEGGWGKVQSPKAGELLTLRLLASNQPPEHRLRYLVRIAQAFAALCRDGPKEAVDAVKGPLLLEARALAKTPVERILAVRVEDAFDPPASYAARRFLWAPPIFPAEGGRVDELRGFLDWGRRDPEFARPEPDNPLPMPVNLGSAIRDRFHVDMRDERGMTALMAAAAKMQIATTRVMLESGANVNVLTDTGGHSALDLVLARAAADVKEKGTEGQEAQLLRMIDLLVAAKPAPTLHPDYRQELLQPGQWKATPHVREFWAEVSKRVAPLAGRDPVKLTCPNPPVARPALGLITSPAP